MYPTLNCTLSSITQHLPPSAWLYPFLQLGGFHCILFNWLLLPELFVIGITASCLISQMKILPLFLLHLHLLLPMPVPLCLFTRTVGAHTESQGTRFPLSFTCCFALFIAVALFLSLFLWLMFHAQFKAAPCGHPAVLSSSNAARGWRQRRRS